MKIPSEPVISISLIIDILLHLSDVNWWKKCLVYQEMDLLLFVSFQGRIPNNNHSSTETPSSYVKIPAQIDVYMQNHKTIKTPSHVYLYPSSSLPGLVYVSINHSHLHWICCYLVLEKSECPGSLQLLANGLKINRHHVIANGNRLGNPPPPIFAFLPQSLTCFFSLPGDRRSRMIGHVLQRIYRQPPRLCNGDGAIKSHDISFDMTTL